LDFGFVASCTVTGQMKQQPCYLKEFLEYWTPEGRYPQGMVQLQLVHSPSGRSVAGNVATT
jgi:hypothetical protein